MNLQTALRLVIVWAVIMLLILLSDVAILAPVTSRALGTAPATNTARPTAVSWINAPKTVKSDEANRPAPDLGAYRFGIPRPDQPPARVRYVVLTADSWVSPKEDRVVVSGQRVYHRTIVRRLR